MSSLKKILLVEDNPKDLELTLVALERSQLANEVITARDGVEALDWLLSQGAHVGRSDGDPAVVLLDLKLPKIDGLEVLERIKTNPDTRHIPVVMLTASREESDLVKSYDLGVNAFVVKPVDFQDFFRAIRELGMFWAILNETHPGKVRTVPMKVTPA
ncbi:MAG: response regulator [Bordetella sp.]|nr:response regulator [Bordetella sp.]